jgi:hypothetical protein
MNSSLVCPKCGSSKSDYASCPSCGHIVWKKQVQQGRCRKCGYFNPAGKTNCLKCGCSRLPGLSREQNWESLLRGMIPVLVVAALMLACWLSGLLP